MPVDGPELPELPITDPCPGDVVAAVADFDIFVCGHHDDDDYQFH